MTAVFVAALSRGLRTLVEGAPRGLLEAAYLVAPLLVAGAVHAPVIKFDLAPALARPLDFGRTFHDRPILGRNKTWRGLLLMSGVSVLIVFAQSRLYDLETFRAVSLLDYDGTSPLLLGSVFGLSYSLSELPNSFVKRRFGIAPGAVSPRHRFAQYVIDQADSAAGGTVALMLFIGPRAATLLLVFAVGFGLHVVMDQLFFFWAVKRRDSVAGMSATSATAIGGSPHSRSWRRPMPRRRLGGTIAGRGWE